MNSGLKETIPPMTHPLSRHWIQPSVHNIEIDETHALMGEVSFKELKDYSASLPSGVYEGKMWKSKYRGSWYLVWYGFAEGDFCSNNFREILLA